MKRPTQRELALEQARRLATDHGLSFEELRPHESARTSPWERSQRHALDHCRQMVDFWRIRPSELRRAAPAARPSAAPKYRHPVSGQVWNGEGAQPQWLKDALLREGYTVEDLRQAAGAAQQ